MIHKDLDVWKRSIQFVTEIYKVTNRFPETEKYGLVNQLRRASVSIPSNISEGASRNYCKEFIQFLYIALSSTAEIETQLIISKNLEFLNDGDEIFLLSELDIIAKMIQGLIKSLKQKDLKRN